jgi:hypothetical protein
MYARCGNSDFPPTVNNHSAEIPENMKFFFKTKHNPNWIGNPEGVSGYPGDSEVYKSEEKGNRSKWPQKNQETENKLRDKSPVESPILFKDKIRECGHRPNLHRSTWIWNKP